MTKLRTRSAAAAITGGILILGGVAVAPALAYPPGTALALGCDAASYAPGATAVCTLTNANPAGPNDITLGGLVGAGSGLSLAFASLAAQDSTTFTENLVLPSVPGTYEVVGTSAGETATTTVTVTSGEQPGAFALRINDDGSVVVTGATPGCSITVLVNGTSAGTGTVGSNGSVTVDAGVSTGDRVVAEQTASDSCEALETSEVVAGDGTGGGGGGGTGGGGGGTGGQPTTPDTGANVALGLAAGAGALAVGGGLFAASRRKRV